MALQRTVYRPRDAEHTVLHQVIAEHLETFLAAVAEAGDGAGLPQFVEREFRESLTCGVFDRLRKTRAPDTKVRKSSVARRTDRDDHPPSDTASRQDTKEAHHETDRYDG